MMDLTDDEQLLFRHRAQIKGKDGEVVVTNTRLSFSTSAPSEGKNFAWANVSGVKYSPVNEPKGRAMVLLKTVMQGDEDVVILLVGATKEENFQQLESMKSIISKVRKSSGKAASSQKVSTIASSSTGAKRSQNGVLITDVKRRKQLLDSDKYIAKQYRDLVEVNKILSEEDFWSVHAQQLQLASDASSTDQALSFKGKQNSLLAKSFDKDSNGVINVNLTVEMRQNIFAMYPEVRKAFDSEVPLKRSETEFWTIYLQSEFYNGRSGGSATSSADLPPQRDDLFARYSEKEDTAGKKHKLTGLLRHSDVDLTASFGDYRAAEPVEASESEGAAAVDTAGLVSARYNRNSGIVVGELASVAAGAPLPKVSTMDAQGTSLDELLVHPEPDYIQVHVKALEPPSTSTDPPVTASSSVSSSQLRSLHLADTGSALRSLASSIPAADRGGRYFAAEINRHKKVSARQTAAQAGKEQSTAGVSVGLPAGQFNPLEMLGIAEEYSGKQSEATSEDGALLDDQFKQDLLEVYTDVTELLRHFYAILSRSGAAAPVPGNAAATKAEAIMTRLTEVAAQQLEPRKRQAAEAFRSSPERKEAALALVNGVLQLVQRANVTWGVFIS